MKKTKGYIVLLTIVLFVGCAPDDFTGNPPSDPENQPPQAFELLPLANNEESNLQPTLAWNAAVDPDGDPVVYDIFLGTEEEPVNAIATNLTNTNYTLEEPLDVLTAYHWNVVAKDNNGGVSQSNTNTFTTRGINSLLLVENAEFSRRRSHKVEEYKEQFWLIGGRAVNGFTSEVWSSLDGVAWNAVTAEAPFGTLNGFTTAVFNDRLWVIAGADGNTDVQKKVWSSNDGIDWVLATDDPGFSARHLHTTEVFDGKLWVIGGYDGGQRKNDVWSSVDGIVWEEMTDRAAFTAREDHASTVFDNKICYQKL